jgi:hypothetical protein
VGLLVRDRGIDSSRSGLASVRSSDSLPDSRDVKTSRAKSRASRSCFGWGGNAETRSFSGNGSDLVSMGELRWSEVGESGCCEKGADWMCWYEGREVTANLGTGVRWWMGVGTIGSSKHNEMRFCLTIGGKDSTSSGGIALAVPATVLIVPVDGNAVELSEGLVAMLPKTLSGDSVTRRSALISLGGDVGSRLASGEVEDRAGVARLPALSSLDFGRVVVSLSDTTPGALRTDGLELAPCAILANLSLTFVGGRASFLGGAGGIECGDRGLTGEATDDEGIWEGIVSELISIRGLRGSVLFDIALPGLRGWTSDANGASSSD